ncbi:uncharacterized protein MELLADRAFT_95423 [Melampsora larici-populina 98AG31]|uniref:protein-serine/threonine phosphatase n=1 Tax=Melampsora larici-populina (strain 98AG31 / pathotype 3-4-7) TaxID=747676 RepID=F4S992_MELLP|nr:uncharacterized protein MELLADRAFT_95423 [Melampsora larici-populina 98AG31]EGF98778.1 hypothetical protein MELLADRAFT_95423 [Melampsora larici-populina 98AG31]
MGQTLSEPVVEKHTDSGEDDRLAYGVSEMQGWRLTMEDAHATILNLNMAPPVAADNAGDQSQLEERHSFFAVYDGHGGSSVARFSGDTVHYRLRSTEEYQRRDFPAALKRAFLATDEDLRSNPEFNNDPSGCTAVAALITHDGRILVANAGDSRSVLSVNGVVKPMSYDHKPSSRTENSRIVAAGGFVEFGRVNGNLALSRALGDFEFKQNKSLGPEDQVVTADPDIITHQIGPEDEFLILACDGIWDVYSNQQVVDRVRRLIGERKSLEEICESMIDRSIAPDCEWGGVGCDNMTFMIVAILGDKTKGEWYDMICNRLQNGEGHQTPTTFPDPFAQGSRGFPLNSALSNYNEIASPPSYQTSGDESNEDPESNEVTQSAPNSDTPDQEPPPANPNSSIPDTPPPSSSTEPSPSSPPTSHPISSTTDTEPSSEIDHA